MPHISKCKKIGGEIAADRGPGRYIKEYKYIIIKFIKMKDYY
jgi:hypothetical protein